MLATYPHHDLTITVLDAVITCATSTTGSTRQACGYAVIKGKAGIAGLSETAEFLIEIDETGGFRNFNHDGYTTALYDLIEHAGATLHKTVDGDEAIADLPRHLFSVLRVREAILYSASIGAPVGRDAPKPALMGLFG